MNASDDDTQPLGEYLEWSGDPGEDWRTANPTHGRPGDTWFGREMRRLAEATADDDDRAAAAAVNAHVRSELTRLTLEPNPIFESPAVPYVWHGPKQPPPVDEQRVTISSWLNGPDGDALRARLAENRRVNEALSANLFRDPVADGPPYLLGHDFTLGKRVPVDPALAFGVAPELAAAIASGRHRSDLSFSIDLDHRDPNLADWHARVDAFEIALAEAGYVETSPGEWSKPAPRTGLDRRVGDLGRGERVLLLGSLVALVVIVVVAIVLASLT